MGWRIVLVEGANAGTTFDLGVSDFWLGRDPSCDVRFDPSKDLTVSARHLRLSCGDQGLAFFDASTNGTLVNGVPQKEGVLQDGDVVELGAGGPKLRAERVAGLCAQTQDALSATPKGATVRDCSIEIRATLLPGGDRLAFVQPLIRFGRDPESDVAFDVRRDRMVSLNHAKISVVDQEATLFDLESMNGTFVGGERIARRVLVGGEVVEFGLDGPRVRLELSRHDPVTAVVEPTGGASTLFVSDVALRDLRLGPTELLGDYPLQPELVIGRDVGCGIVLDSPFVSKRHVRVQRQGERLALHDLGSANGIFVRGKSVRQIEISEGEEFSLGPYLVKYASQALLVFDTRSRASIDALDLCRWDARRQHCFLDHVTLKIRPGDFLCILGPSGCGKSTLLKCLNGYARADEGRVLLNGVDFYGCYEQLKYQVGYVPQDDIVHSELSVERTLRYAAGLRLPVAVGRAERERRIADVLSTLELHDHRHRPVGQLSGGQRKRVSIGVELLTEPAVLYLDEATSGLDPNLEEKMMLLLRELTLRGKTVVAVTHTLDHVRLADKVAFLAAGQLAFLGSADEAREFFDVEQLPGVYKRLDEPPAADGRSLQQTFRESEVYRRHIGGIDADHGASTQAIRRSGRRFGRSGWVQFGLLVGRYAEIMVRDVRNTLILLSQAPLVGLFVVLALSSKEPETAPTSTVLLLMSLSALWFGCSNAARELTKERSIFDRERMVGLRIVPYVCSKFFVLQLLALVQVASMLAVVYWFRPGYQLAEVPHLCERWQIDACRELILAGLPGSFGAHFLNLYLTALSGIGLGLLISAVAGNSDKAMSLVPLILIPQVLFSGGFGLPQTDEPVRRGLGYVMALNWSLDQGKRIAMCAPEDEKGPRGCKRCIHAYDPNKARRLGEEPQEAHGRCAALAQVLSALVEQPETISLMEDGWYTQKSQHRAGPPGRAHPSYRGMIALLSMAGLWFVLVCLFVRLRDRQHY